LPSWRKDQREKEERSFHYRKKKLERKDHERRGIPNEKTKRKEGRLKITGKLFPRGKVRGRQKSPSVFLRAKRAGYESKKKENRPAKTVGRGLALVT